MSGRSATPARSFTSTATTGRGSSRGRAIRWSRSAAAAPGDAWAIGKNRTLLRLSGGAWKAVEMPKIENEEQLADLLVLPNGEAWIVGGTTKSSLVGEELTSLCFVGHYDGAAWRFDEDEDCGPLGRVWGAAPDNVWADGADVVYWNGRILTKNPRQKAGARSSDGMAARADGSWRASGAGAAPASSMDPRGNQASIGDVRDFWAFGPEDVWAIGANGALTHFDGSALVTRRRSGCAACGRRARGRRRLGDRSRRRRCCTSMGATGGHGACPERPAAIRSPLPRPRQATSGCSRPVELMRFDGKRWTNVLSKPPNAEMFSLFARTPNDVWVGAGSKLLHWNGRVDRDVRSRLRAAPSLGRRARAVGRRAACIAGTGAR